MLVVTDSGVPQQYLSTVLAQCPQGVPVVLEQGEGSKSLAVTERLCTAMLQHGFARKMCIRDRFKGVYVRDKKEILAFETVGKTGTQQAAKIQAHLGDANLDELLTPALHAVLCDDIELLDLSLIHI